MKSGVKRTELCGAAAKKAQEFASAPQSGASGPLYAQRYCALDQKRGVL